MREAPPQSDVVAVVEVIALGHVDRVAKTPSGRVCQRPRIPGIIEKYDSIVRRLGIDYNEFT